MKTSAMLAAVALLGAGVSAQAGVINDWNDGTTQGWAMNPDSPAGIVVTNADNKLSVDFITGYQQNFKRGINAAAFNDFVAGTQLTVETVLPSDPVGQFQISWFLQGQYYAPEDVGHTTPLSYNSNITGTTALTTGGAHTVTWNFNTNASIAGIPDGAQLAWGELRMVTNATSGWDPAPITFDNLTVVVPEPASLGLLGLGSLGLLVRRRK